MTLEIKKAAIEKITNEIIDRMGFKATIYVSNTVSDVKSDQESISVEIESEESKFLIGRQGANLSALQHLIRLMVQKELSENIHFNVDINNYRKQQQQSVIRLTREMADKALKEKKAIILNPMNSYERRIVHMEVESVNGIKTESIGEGPDRKVVIKPISISEEFDL
jgi:spoIIIJ-associated protein